MKPPEKIPVLVDHRESNPIPFQALEEHPEFIPQYGHLKTGDYLVGDKLLVERKTCLDFGLSIVQGRLFRQAMHMAEAAKDRTVQASILIVEGHEDEFQKINISREAILGAMVSIEMKFLLPLFRTMTPGETVKLMDIVYHQMIQESENYGRSFPLRWGKFSRKNRLRNQIYILQGLPGVGASRAKILLDHFGGVGHIFAASENDLCRVPGIGKSTAMRIRKIIEP